MPISTTKEAHAYYAEHGALPEGFRWVRAGGHSVALPSKREGLNFKFIVPPFFRTSPSVEIGSFKPFGSSVTSGFINVAKAAAYAISTDSSINEYVENEFKQKTSNLMEELREAFRANLNRVSPVSNSREVRRAAFTALGVGKQLHGIDEAYDRNLFNRVISGFKPVVHNNGSRFSFGFYGEVSGSKHPDFKGLRSGYKGPDQVSLSIYGLNVVSPRGTATNGNKMIVPLGVDTNSISNSFGVTGYWRADKSKTTRVFKNRPSVLKQGGQRWVNYGYTKRFDAVITDGGQFVYPSKSNIDSLDGVPVKFANRINVSSRFYNNPRDAANNRVVFWGYADGRYIFRNNVMHLFRKYQLVANDSSGAFEVI